jgi:hypothetical protein
MQSLLGSEGSEDEEAVSEVSVICWAMTPEMLDVAGESMSTASMRIELRALWAVLAGTSNNGWNEALHRHFNWTGECGAHRLGGRRAAVSVRRIVSS